MINYFYCHMIVVATYVGSPSKVLFCSYANACEVLPMSLIIVIRSVDFFFICFIIWTRSLQQIAAPQLPSCDGHWTLTGPFHPSGGPYRALRGQSSHLTNSELEYWLASILFNAGLAVNHHIADYRPGIIGFKTFGVWSHAKKASVLRKKETFLQ